MDVRKEILEAFGSIKTAILELFDERYASVIEVAAATTIAIVAATGVQGRGSFQYRDFSNMNPKSLMGSTTQSLLLGAI